MRDQHSVDPVSGCVMDCVISVNNLHQEECPTGQPDIVGSNRRAAIAGALYICSLRGKLTARYPKYNWFLRNVTAMKVLVVQISEPDALIIHEVYQFLSVRRNIYIPSRDTGHRLAVLYRTSLMTH
ncbi:hypothetical protein CBL_11311 [Carabus blaptoides fortunei]